MCIVCKYLLTAGLREQNINVTQLWPGILKFSRVGDYPSGLHVFQSRFNIIFGEVLIHEIPIILGKQMSQTCFTLHNKK